MSEKYWPEPTPDKPNIHSSDIGWIHAFIIFFGLCMAIAAILLILIILNLC